MRVPDSNSFWPSAMESWFVPSPTYAYPSRSAWR